MASGKIRIKIGESSLVVNEKGQLCELVNIPASSVRKDKDKIIEVGEDEHVDEPVNGLNGSFGSINFRFRKQDVDNELGW
jgi:hypothetical protein